MIFAALCIVLLSVPAFAGAVISWFDLYPIHFYPADDNDGIPESGAGYITYPASCNWFVREKEDSFSFDFLDAQAAQLKSLGLSGSIICEVNPLYHASAPWLSAKCLEAGETVKNQNGGVSPQPAISSPVFLREQKKLVEAWMEHLASIDPENRIKYVHPGAEWWFNVYERYGDTDVAAFRNWLRNKYKNLSALNAAWNSAFVSFDEVTPPVVQFTGNGVSGSRGQSVVTDSALGDCQAAYIYGPLLGGPGNAKQLIPAASDGEYTLSFEVKTEGLKGCACAEVEFSNADNSAFVVFKGSPFVREQDSDWHTVSCAIKAPAAAGYMNVQLELMGRGKVSFRNFALTDANGKQLSKPLSEWNEVVWSGSGQSFSRDGEVCVIENRSVPGHYKNEDAAVYDWTVFWYGHAAKWINYTHRLFKECSRGRKTVSYLTHAFAWGVEWDTVAATAISLDRVLMDSGAIDEIGLQVCSADGDDFRITCALDTARKYKKPLWAVDLVDFTSGVYIGEWYINKMAQNAVASGAHGLVYCGWNLKHLTDDYSYKNHVSAEALGRINSLAENGINILEGKKAPREAAIVYTNLPASSNDAAGYKNSPFSFMGWYKILKACMVNVDVVSLAELEKRPGLLAGYKYVVVPDCPYISDKARKEIMRDPDKVYFGGRFGLFSETGSPLKPLSPETREDLGEKYCGILERDTHAGNTPPLLLWGEETAERAATLHKGIETLRPRLKKAGVALPFEGGNMYIHATRWQNGKETVYYLVNQKKTGAFHLSMPYRTGMTVLKDGKEFLPQERGGRTEIGSFDTSCIVRIPNEK